MRTFPSAFGSRTLGAWARTPRRWPMDTDRSESRVTRIGDYPALGRVLDALDQLSDQEARC